MAPMGGASWSVPLGLALATAVLAGCVTAPETGTVPGSQTVPGTDGEPLEELTFATKLEERFNATLGSTDYSLDDWVLLSMETGPHSPVAAFEWKVPSGGVNPTNWDKSVSTVSLEVVPVYPPGQPRTVTQFVLAFFEVEGGKATWLSQHSRGTWHEVYRTGPVEERSDYAYVGSAGSYYWPADDRLEDGETVYVVLAVRSEKPGEFGLALRVLDHDPDWGQEYPPADLDAFLNNVTGRAPHALPRLGTGQGFSFPVYVDGRELWQAGYEGWTPYVTFRDDLPTQGRPMVGARDFTAEFSFDAESGYGAGTAGVWGYGSLGSWSVQGTLHGTEYARSDDLGPAILGYASEPYWSGSGYWVTAEGPGGAEATFQAKWADGLMSDWVWFVHFSLGATLEELLGMPAAETEQYWTPGNEEAPRLTQRGDALELRLPDGSLLWLPHGASHA